MHAFGISSEDARFCFCVTLTQIVLFAVFIALLIVLTLVTFAIVYRETLFRRIWQPFRYRKLHNDEIRLIVIKRGLFSDPVIRCSIKYVEHSQRPEYWALSYVWGDATAQKPIICSGTEIQISTGLYTALRRIRSPHGEIVLWADAICINQSDVEERGAQVAMMGRIYSLAAQVIIWLGEEEEFEGKRAFAFLASLDAFFGARSPSYAAGGPIEASPDLLTGIQQMNFTVLKKLFDRPWFGRLWVVQEVVKSQAATLVFGTSSIPWAMLAHVLTGLGTIDGGDLLSGQVGETAVQNIGSIISTAHNQEKYQLRENSDMDMASMLYQLRSFNCSEPIDKIYALLGLAWSEGLHPDYSLTAHEATCKFVEWCCKTEGSLNFLFLAGKSSNDDLEQELPSWFPQVSKKDSARPIIAGSFFNASNVPSSIERRTAMLKDVSITGDVLSLQGSNFGDLNAISQPFLPYNPEIRGYGEQREMYVELAKTIITCLKLAHESSVSFEDSLENERYVQFCNTISVGRWRLQADGLNLLHTLISRVKTYQDGKDVTVLIGSDQEEYSKVYPLFSLVATAMYQRRFAIASGNRLALVPKLARQGDVIVIFKGTKVPFVVRPGNDGCFTLIGECYVQGIMMGEVMDNPSPTWDEIKLK